MRVIIVTQTFPPRFGGMQSVMSALAKNFSKTIPTFVLPDHQIPDSHPIRSYKIKFNFSNFPKCCQLREQNLSGSDGTK